MTRQKRCKSEIYLFFELKNLSSTVNSRFKRNSIFPFLNRELFDFRKIYVVNLKTGRPKKMPYVGEFAT